jgi:hypothetical protein
MSSRSILIVNGMETERAGAGNSDPGTPKR